MPQVFRFNFDILEFSKFGTEVKWTPIFVSKIIKFAENVALQFQNTISNFAMAVKNP